MSRENTVLSQSSGIVCKLGKAAPAASFRFISNSSSSDSDSDSDPEESSSLLHANTWFLILNPIKPQLQLLDLSNSNSCKHSSTSNGLVDFISYFFSSTL